MDTARISVLGSCNMDLVAFAERAPRLGETVRGRRFVTVPGGKGANQAIGAARAGGRVAMIGAVGADHHGQDLRATLREAGVATSALRVAAETTGTAHITVDDRAGNAIVVVPGANGTVTGLTAADERVVAASRVLLMQLELPLEAVAAGAAAARRSGVTVVLTPAPVCPLPDALLADVDLVVANEYEAAELAGRERAEGAARPGAGRRAAGEGEEAGPANEGPAGEADLAGLLRRVPRAIVTLGAAGCRYGAADGTRLCVAAPRVEAVDTTAAGDSFVGALAVVLAEGGTMDEALRWGTAAGALAVQREGASSSMPARAEIAALAAGLTVTGDRR